MGDSVETLRDESNECLTTQLKKLEMEHNEMKAKVEKRFREELEEQSKQFEAYKMDQYRELEEKCEEFSELRTKHRNELNTIETILKDDTGLEEENLEILEKKFKSLELERERFIETIENEFIEKQMLKKEYDEWKIDRLKKHLEQLILLHDGKNKNEITHLEKQMELASAHRRQVELITSKYYRENQSFRTEVLNCFSSAHKVNHTQANFRFLETLYKNCEFEKNRAAIVLMIDKMTRREKLGDFENLITYRKNVDDLHLHCSNVFEYWTSEDYNELKWKLKEMLECIAYLLNIFNTYAAGKNVKDIGKLCQHAERYIEKFEASFVGINNYLQKARENLAPNKDDRTIDEILKDWKKKIERNMEHSDHSQ